jgi:hypothetical protein
MARRFFITLKVTILMVFYCGSNKKIAATNNSHNNLIDLEVTSITP